MSESKRLELRQMYDRGWDAWDAELLCSTLADGFYFDDPALKEPVTIETMPEYMAGWKDRVKALGIGFFRGGKVPVAALRLVRVYSIDL